MEAILKNIQQRAAEIAAMNTGRAEDEGAKLRALAEMVEGLAQALNQMVVETKQGWAPVTEEKTNG